MPSDTCACGHELGKLDNGDMEPCPTCGRLIVESEDGTFAYKAGRVRLGKAAAKISVWCPDCRQKRRMWEAAKKVRDKDSPQRAMFSAAGQDHLDALEAAGVVESETLSPDGVREYVVYEFVGGEIPEIDETIAEYWEDEDIPDTCKCDACGCSVDVQL